MPTDIMIVEDSPTQAAMLEELLRSHGYETQTAVDGQRALEAARRRPPALIISDVTMPVMNGFQLCLAVKQDPRLCHIPVILLTSLSAPRDLLSALEAGADFHVPKPYHDDHLLRKIAEALAHRSEAGRAGPVKVEPVSVNGVTYRISASREKTLGLLLSTYEVAVGQYQELVQTRDELVALNESLELRVRERTSSLMDEMTERRQAEAALRELNVSLEQRVNDRTAELLAANKELEAFSYSVSHDLRAPLRAMDGFSMALLEDSAGKLDETAQGYLRRIRAGSQRMAELIDDLLNLSRITRAEMRRERVDLTAMAEEIGAEFKVSCPDRQVELVVTRAMVVRADGPMLRVVLNNLLGNAWKYTARCAQARIEVGAQEQDGKRVFFVRDNGAGFDMAYVGKLFGAFQRLHSAQEFEGTGIGLALVQRIIHRHGGCVRAEGAVGQGATFYFTLEEKGD
jgi:signal transduction histidine kinase